MVNVNILNKVLDGISKQIPLVHSFYTQSPYDAWNKKEIEYGSVSFVVTNVNTNNNTTTYDAVLYYADRLTEDRSNRDSVHSDAATVIQTIVGALNQTDSDYFEIEYPVNITLFEQDFTDVVAGGYANLSIEVEGMGECFDDEFAVPEIIATSAYYTKDEITELFPLKTQLSKVAFSGSFNDLFDAPNIVTDIQYNQFAESVSNNIKTLNNALEQKVSSNYFEGWADDIEKQLSDTIGTQQYNNLVEGLTTVKTDVSALKTDKLDSMTFNNWVTTVTSNLASLTPLSEFNAFVKGQNTINMNLAVEMKNAVKSQYVDSVVDSLKALISTKAGQQAFDNFIATTNSNFNKVQSELDSKVSKGAFENAIAGVNYNINLKADKTTFDSTVLGLNNVISNLAVEIAEKMDKDYFDGWKDGIVNSIDSKVSKQAFDVALSNIYTKNETDQLIDTKVDKVVGEYVKSDAVENIVNGIVNDTIDNIVEDVTEAVRVEIDDIVSEELDSQLNDYVTVDDLEDAVAEQYNNFISSDAFKEEIKTVIENSVTDFVGDVVTEAELQSKNFASKYYVDNKFDAANTNLELAVNDINTKFGNYYTKSETDAKIATAKPDLSDYYTKAQVDAKDNDVKAQFSSYYAKSEIDAKLDTVNSKIESIENTGVDLSDYYTKAEVNDIIDNIEVSGGDVDLSNYYTKSETYSKTEIDAIVGNINTILDNVLYTK